MKNFRQIILFFGLLTSLFISAQQVVKVDTISGNTLKISTNQKINDLLQTVEDKCSTANNFASNDNSSVSKINVPEKALTTAEICRRNPRIMGVKILVATVKSNQEANEVALYFRSKFPSLKVIKDASLRPNYKVMAGSYFNKDSARADFNNVKRLFKDARLVNYYIFCVEAK